MGGGVGGNGQKEEKGGGVGEGKVASVAAEANKIKRLFGNLALPEVMIR